ncbi:hypothetical protein [Ralstonia flatus]|uniref:Uncharacterized protein n=1 Tax=Ralstonia flatus TaxID=3058601 RepID=A0ABN9JZQ8_9RALS|nr:hypothetical protein [Ralstonia sp. LMG 32965]MBN6210796.1 hypothetical protein [Ralstonia pickettii]CAJ0855048.1 hypothetical protein R77564_00249 [Ralstonia sp. LMG 32965]
MSVKDAIEFIKQRGGFNSYRALADAAGVNLRRIDNAVARGSALTASEEAKLGKAAGMNPVAAIALLEQAYDPATANLWKVFRKLLSAAKPRNRLAA